MPDLGEGSHELSSASLGDKGRNCPGESVALPSPKGADVDEINAFELGASLKTTERSHDPTLQLGGWKGDPECRVRS